MERKNEPAGSPLTLGVPLAGPPPVPPAGGAAPLHEDDYLAVRQGALEYATIRRTIKTARTSATITLVIGALALLTAALSVEWLATLTAAEVCAVGAVEFAGARRLQRGQPWATRMLAVNQLCFLALIVVYCGIQMALLTPARIRGSLVSSEFRSALAGLPDMQRTILDPIEQWAPLAIYGIYGGTILLSGLIQGSLAWRYRVCGRRLAAFTAHTPPWVYRLLRETQSD